MTAESPCAITSHLKYITARGLIWVDADDETDRIFGYAITICGTDLGINIPGLRTAGIRPVDIAFLGYVIDSNQLTIFNAIGCVLCIVSEPGSGIVEVIDVIGAGEIKYGTYVLFRDDTEWRGGWREF